MNKKLLLTSIGAILLLNSSFAYGSYDYSKRGNPLHDRYGCVDESDRLQNNTHYDVYERAPKRPGFQNDELPFTYKSQTFGDTTYHTYDHSPSRKGFGG